MSRVKAGVDAVRDVVVKHPATYSKAILEKLDELIGPGIWLDPFIGTGKLYSLTRPDRQFVGVELEPEWAGVDPRTICGDSLAWMTEIRDEGVTRFDGVVTSPVYGNRMSDHHDAKDGSRRRSYKFDLGRDVSEGSSCEMYFWQPEYQAFHLAAWSLAFGVTRDGGLMHLNVKNFIRNREPQYVVAWHMGALKRVGWKIEKVVQVGVPGLRDGENYEARFDTEAIIIAKRSE